MNPTIRPLPLTSWDEREGIDGRWEVRWPDATDILGYRQVHVIHVTPKGRFAVAPYFLCTGHYETDSRQADEARFCEDVKAVRESAQKGETP